LLSVAVEYAGQALTDHVTLVFQVSDTGQGMTQEQMDKLFTEYTRFYTETNRTVEGTGLGLNITRNLVHMMKGEISVESEQGKGSTFTVRLPQKLVNSEMLDKELTKNLMDFHFGEKAQLKKAQQITREYMPYGRILIVDDVQTNLFVARGLMAPYGLSMDTAANGFDAVERIKRGDSYDLILMDHFMPKMDGMEATKIIRGLGYTNSIVALTANAVSGQAEMFMENGFDDFISKPIDIRQLNTILNKLVRDRYPAETIEAARRLKKDLDSHSATGISQESASSQIKDFFVRDAKNAVNILESMALNSDGFIQEEMEQYRVTVHGMKSALANIGEKELSAVALKLEQAARNRNIGVISAETPEFIQALQSLIVKFKPVQEDNYLEISADDLSFLQEKLLTIKKVCGDFDNDAAEAALRELKQKKWPNHIIAVLDDIAAHILHSDFDKAADLAETTANNP
jgi:CheY-like chemotaxis protein